MAEVAYALTEGDVIYGVIFDEDLAHEIAGEYNFEISEIADFIEYEQPGLLN